ncbi:HNH endonuclease signature motif containing protein [Nocardia flavorosea]|uniref:HNH endonuclease n=1 Tax=Nocardia flavorosea TaxID=53429 RepID=A0A846YRP1_9NOCA|nr:HNH endonuclease signature motif containing protein [Nocardia flavorosea]NKY60341.1 HNH endonuclease [Nocardia flavorosea]
MWRVDPDLSPDECWIWRGARGGTKKRTGIGYGKFTVNGRQYDAHRVSWEIHNGQPVPPGMQVLHSCDNPLCVNPKHLSIGSNRDNVDDMVSKMRQTYGERNPQSVLTDEAVRDIRSSSASDAALAVKYGVGKSCIADARYGRTWRHIA